MQNFAFDPSQELQFSQYGNAPEEKGNPNIESFVKHPEINIEADFITHSCEVTFKSPKDISQEEIMSYILGIGEALGVDVDSFKWSKLNTSDSTTKTKR
jgi:hypothetical protein